MNSARFLTIDKNAREPFGAELGRASHPSFLGTKDGPQLLSSAVDSILLNIATSGSFKPGTQNHNSAECRLQPQELHSAQMEILDRLAAAAEFRDDSTGKHTRRIGETCALIAAALGKSDSWMDLLRRAAPLHDLGKIGIPDSILRKRGRLTHEEFEIMKTHTAIGSSILSGSQSPALQMAEVIARTHHERWDGSGYAKLKAEAIPLESRIVAVADVFDALIHERPYKPAWTVKEALLEIQSQSERHFDPRIVRALLEVVPLVLAINQSVDAGIHSRSDVSGYDSSSCMHTDLL